MFGNHLKLMEFNNFLTLKIWYIPKIIVHLLCNNERDMKTITDIKKELRLYQWDKEIKDIEFDTIHTPKGNTPMERVEIDSIDIPTYIDETPLDLLDNQITIQTLFEEAKLSDRQIEVLQMFYGLGCEELTTHQISEKLGLGICRIQQIKEKSIRMLRKIKNNIQL